jgi:hypothetical protein
LATVLASAVVIAGSATAHAEGTEPDLDPDAVAAQIDTLAPPEEVQAPIPIGDEAVATVDGGLVAIPDDATEPIRLESTGVDSPDLSIVLPELDDLTPAALASDGTVVYGSDEGVALAVQVVEEGIRIQTVSTGPEAPTEFSYEFGDSVTPAIQPDGSVELTEDTGTGVAVTVGHVEAPWAFDAAGEPVVTEYRTAGNQLIQTLEVDPAAEYPIVADPKLTITWWNQTLYFNKKETGIVAAGTFGGSTIAGYFGVPGKVISAVLAVYGTAAGVYLAAGKCLKLVQYIGVPTPVPQPYWGTEAGSYCK